LTTPKTIIDLVDRFNRNIEAYRSGAYNETQVRREFIDPMFKALGWDIDNESGYAEAYKDVIHEDAIKIGGVTKAPDYCFRIGGTRKFFLEAKKPSINLANDISSAYQLRRYAWSAKLPLSILSDFDEFAVYDCRIKPESDDKASTARILLLKYTDYIEKWDLITSVFSREEVLKGSFDKYIESVSSKRGTAEVDSAFLEEMEYWRDLLAKNIALRNPNLTQRELNFSVQITIDRIVFLRICEDRGIENYGNLFALMNGSSVYSRLGHLFNLADQRYNSGLFYFDIEKNRPGNPDTLTPGLAIDDKILKEIIKRLYYPDSPYEFSVLPVEILGHVYEQFLGKVIRLTKNHQAKVEEKPEVRKAGGVYYTPKYIVDYIVKNTIGKRLDGKSPKSLSEISKLTILDPACGSGSFLLGAYQYLLDWYLQYYTGNEAEKWAKGKNPAIFQSQNGEWRLTTSERKRILLNHIYGVDIDSQAVEVTKLSLLLKVLEGEDAQTIGKSYALIHERVLPDLGNNIKCGNSLIGPDFYVNGELNLFGEEEVYRINAFNWENEFSAIMKRGGFDVVIGNPPYRMVQPHNTRFDLLNYLKEHFHAVEFKLDLFHLFLEKGVTLLNNSGKLGFIIPATILNNVHAENMRRYLMEKASIDLIAVSNQKIFEAADVFTSVVVFQREPDAKKRNTHRVSTSPNLTVKLAEKNGPYNKIIQRRFLLLPGAIWNLQINEKNAKIIHDMINNYPSLGSIAKINRGLITGNKEEYFSKTKNTKKHVPILIGGDVFRYNLNEPSSFVLFEKPESAGGCWDQEVHFAEHKLLIRQIGDRPTAAILMQPIAVSGNIFTIIGDSIEQELFLLGIINSSLMRYFWQIMFCDYKVSFPQVTLFSLSMLPIRISKNITDTNTKKLVSLVTKIYELNKNLRKVNVEHEKIAINRIIKSTDREIDKLVYSIYGLKKVEIGLIESHINK
jgi:type I restriction-modification system DNA methylase subunit